MERARARDELCPLAVVEAGCGPPDRAGGRNVQVVVELVERVLQIGVVAEVAPVKRELLVPSRMYRSPARNSYTGWFDASS
jgi:hypothetical protein